MDDGEERRGWRMECRWYGQDLMMVRLSGIDRNGFCKEGKGTKKWE